jgi:hypothetical protein
MTLMFAMFTLGLTAQAPAAPTPAVLPAESQIAAAVQAAPEDRRMGATVLGYDASGALVTLRPGTNDIVCLADDPKDAAFSVACYHKDLEPFMARGRELAGKGVTGKEREETRWKEIESGAIKMPREPRTLHVLTGSGFDAATGTVASAYLRWVIYTPFATPETTGLPIRPVEGGPWLMFPGTPTAHIMISPPRPPKP